MAINFKPINEVPVVNALSDGDTLLVNSGGTAKQIDAKLVGGGGTVIYIKDFAPSDDMTTATGSPCKDAEMTQIMTTEELLAAFAAGPVVLVVTPGDIDVWACPLMTAQQEGVVISVIMLGESAPMLSYLCSDTSA